MNCGYGEKLILYAYGEAEAGLKASVEAHLAGCAACRGELAALGKAGAWLSAYRAEPSPSAVAAVLLAARAARRGFSFGWREAVLSGALAAVLAGVFSFSSRSAGADLAWNSGLDSKLDSVEYSVYQAQSEMTAASADWDYRYSALEDESLNAGDNV
jgi:anti-sigma factor RsiW